MLIHAYFFITTCLGLGIKSVTWNSNRTQTKKPDPLQVWNVKKYSNVQIIMQYKYLKQNICTSNIQFNIYFDMISKNKYFKLKSIKYQILYKSIYIFYVCILNFRLYFGLSEPNRYNSNLNDIWLFYGF